MLIKTTVKGYIGHMIFFQKIKKVLLGIYLKFQVHPLSQHQLNETITNAKQDLESIDNVPCPYFQEENFHNKTAQRDDIVFITSRFRSGSTLLWNIFRNLEGCTSLYEPFNERKWFDKENRGEQVDTTHVGVDDYSQEYNNMESLSKYYQDSWIDKSLYMDKKSWDPDMMSYICEMIEKSPNRPVLQFNRIDFRLPWLKQHFPNAKFIHLYRHPRDQWYSFLIDKQKMNKDDVQNTYEDAFYLDVWCDDLAKHFPFLDKRVTTHPYQRFYYLWKLSYLYGKKLCHQSISFENLTTNSKSVLTDLFVELNIDIDQVDNASTVLNPPPLDKWKKYADNTWFEALEKECEKQLLIFLDAQKS